MLSLFYWYFRPTIKWFLRKTTRLTELQRICYGETPGAPRTCGVENALMLSRSLPVQEACLSLDLIVKLPGDIDREASGNNKDEEKRMTGKSDEHASSSSIKQGGKGNYKSRSADVTAAFNHLIDTVLITKKIKKQLHIQFVRSFNDCVRQIWGYRQLVSLIEEIRKTPYDDLNQDHEAKLMALWTGLQPDIPMVRKDKQWQNIGFQGKDPKTDFRGMGMLGLENLLFFVNEYPMEAARILSHSNHPEHGYFFAIVGINLTDMAYRMVERGWAKSHMYNWTSKRGSGAADSSLEGAAFTVQDFHKFYCYLFIEFDRFWMMEKPATIMEFSHYRDLFESNIKSRLQDSSTCFQINPVVDTI